MLWRPDEWNIELVRVAPAAGLCQAAQAGAQGGLSSSRCRPTLSSPVPTRHMIFTWAHGLGM
jgi:hypothetical protein